MKTNYRDSITETLQDFLERRRFEAEQNGWTDEPLITPDILAKAQKFWHNRGPMVARLLKGSKLSNDTIEAVIEDYKAVLCGIRYLTATVEQMQSAKEKIDTCEACNIDAYGLFTILLNKFYSGCIDCYNFIKRNKDKEDFISLFLTTPIIPEIGKRWAMQTNILPRKEVEAYAVSKGDSRIMWFPLMLISVLSENEDYINFYTLAKYGYIFRNGPALESIRPSMVSKEKEFDLEENVNNLRDQVKLYKLGCKMKMEEERSKRAEEKSKQENIIIARNLASVQSKPIMVQDPEDENKLIIPVTKRIETFLEEINSLAIKGDSSVKNYFSGVKVSEFSFNKIFTGILKLWQCSGHCKKESRSYLFTSTKRDFAIACGYENPNAEEIKGLLYALKSLDGLTYSFLTPEIKETVILADGKKRTKYTRENSIKAITLFSAVDFYMTREKGDLSFRVADILLDGGKIGKGYVMLDSGFYDRFKKVLKGLSGDRLTSQILLKSHKKQGALLYEVFGYENIESKDITLIRGNNRRQLWNMLDTLEDNHLITIIRRPNATTDDEGIWEWRLERP